MAILSNLSVDQGADFLTELAVEDTGGGPADLTNYTVASQIRRSWKSATHYAFNATITSPASAGKITLKLPASISNSMKPGRYLYDVEITIVTGTSPNTVTTVTRVIEGQVEIFAGITQ